MQKRNNNIDDDNDNEVDKCLPFHNIQMENTNLEKY